MASLAVSSSPSSRMHVSGSPDACDCKTTQIRQVYQLKNCKTLTTVSASLDCLWHIRNQLGVFLSSQAARDEKHLELNIDFKKCVGGWLAIIGRNQHRQLIWIFWLKNTPSAGLSSCFRWRYGAPSDAVPARRWRQNTMRLEATRSNVG